MPQEATIKNPSPLLIYVKGTLMENATDIIDWEDVEPSSVNTCNLTVVNNGTSTLIVYFITVNLPSGFTETWTANSTILLPTKAAVGTLTLTVSSVEGSYSWDSYVTWEETP